MKTKSKLLKDTLEYMTQCVLLPGVELNLDEVVIFYKRNIGRLGLKLKYFAVNGIKP